MRTKFTPETLKVIIEIIMILIVGAGLFEARQANRIASGALQIARETLDRSTKPVVKVVTISNFDTNGVLTCEVKNYSDWPALHLRVDSLHDGPGTVLTPYVDDDLMPHDTAALSFRCSPVEAKAINAQIASSYAQVSFRITYESIRGEQITISQSARSIDGKLHDTAYSLVSK